MFSVTHLPPAPLSPQLLTEGRGKQELGKLQAIMRNIGANFINTGACGKGEDREIDCFTVHINVILMERELMQSIL